MVFTVLEYVSTIGALDNPHVTVGYVRYQECITYRFWDSFSGYLFIYRATFWTFLIEIFCFHQDSPI